MQRNVPGPGLHSAGQLCVPRPAQPHPSLLAACSAAVLQFVPSARAEGELGVEAAGGVPAGKAEFIRRKEEGGCIEKWLEQ